MKTWALLAIAAVLASGELFAETNVQALTKLTDQLGGKYWSPPEKRLVRATIYKKGREAGDRQSGQGQSDGKCSLRYASATEAGTLAVPAWLPRGSMVKMHTNDGVRSWIAADEGSGVDRRSAARKEGKTREEKAAPVLDFCAAKQAWPDFVIVDIYYYAGKTPFEKLSAEDQRTLFNYAMQYVRKDE